MSLTDEQTRQIDALVPPPWSRGRRLAAVVLAVGLGAVCLAAWWSGLLGPRLVLASSGWGGELHAPPGEELTARREIVLRNPGLLPVEIQAFGPPPLQGIEWLPTEPALPMTLDPGASATVRMGFTAAGCDVDGGGLDTYPFVARSGPWPARTIDVAAGWVDPHGPGVQEPSWVLEAIAIECEADAGW